MAEAFGFFSFEKVHGAAILETVYPHLYCDIGYSNFSQRRI